MVSLRSLVVTFLLIDLSAATAAQNSAIQTETISGYVRSGPGSFACHIVPEDVARQMQHPDFPEEFPCMRIGPLEMEMLRSDAEKILGSPATSVMSGGREAFLYDLAGDNSGTSYVALTFNRNARVDSLQLTSATEYRGWRFSKIATGDSQQALIGTLGRASLIDEMSKPGVAIWDYSPWSFSFELKDGHVWSIAIWEP
jgi:hypothetical protein